ncbi:MAG: MBOAT family O-acyltransferase [Lachnospiraceae bacterium]|nr:MBOAT family O-acyltransferase [Lachnospiraceae bacterium]
MFYIMTYFSFDFLILVLTAVLLYTILPQKARRFVLLIFSYAFFWAISGKLVIYLAATTLLTYLFGLKLDALQKEEKRLKGEETDREKKKAIGKTYTAKARRVLILAVLVFVGTLAVVKYTPFALGNINKILALCGSSLVIEVPLILAPIGISFYTLQVVAYLADVYWKKIPADHNLLRLALFISFFPQIMEGPICRYTDTAEAIWEAKRTTWHNFIFGFERILYGVMKKIIVADRLNLFIQEIFLNYQNYDGGIILLASVGYTLQLYMDFSGTMDLVIGTAQIFGVTLPENFRQPFFAKTISEFWKRWHITLGTWFKDYIFYPVSMTKPMKKLTSKARKTMGNRFGPLVTGGIALFVVWLCNGIWHGSGWHYIAFGMYHFFFILLGSFLEPVVASFTEKHNINRGHKLYRAMQIGRTWILICIGELIFRAESLSYAFGMLKKIVTGFTLEAFKNGSAFTHDLDKFDLLVLVVVCVVLLVIGLIKERKIEIRAAIARKPVVVQCAIFLGLLTILLIFGAYGPGYLPLDPIYAGF